MELLRAGAEVLGLHLGGNQVAAFERYFQELTAWNQRFNLTAITGYEDVQVRHFLDSLSCLLALPQVPGSQEIPDAVPLQVYRQPLACIDIGSGAGLPGLPIKIMLPDVRMTLVEATGKKVTFLQHMVEVLELENVQVIHARAEDLGHMPEHRERYDLVLARAVARMCVLAEYCLPFCRPGGRMVAPKGEDAQAECDSAVTAFRTLGGNLVGVKALSLPGLPVGHHLVVLSKQGRTPAAYPRRAGLAAKKPLC
ncbi:MAG: 16S rRNA (guanine(527)-N(7))-methyltransferase RsmG [Anaerolineae bacterium]